MWSIVLDCLTQQHQRLRVPQFIIFVERAAPLQWHPTPNATPSSCPSGSSAQSLLVYSSTFFRSSASIARTVSVENTFSLRHIDVRNTTRASTTASPPVVSRPFHLQLARSCTPRSAMHYPSRYTPRRGPEHPHGTTYQYRMQCHDREIWQD